MEYKPIKTQWQYDFVAKRIEQLKDTDPYTPEAEELRLLTEMVVEYVMRKAGFDDSQSPPTHG
ncbi:hypothetical protein ACFSKU_18385 [Pontibacter silvestris]|uniref:Uncharacterized protein n=1 Tax=Pontibacter silvestris TaxID=2305183 RepID=A0ABW4X4D3_9BACT|nr:hypothetical protein [Pontibacter silvestris]MCC9138672.1 hypothetical protein [Pontibacter silvestris]